MTRHLITWIAMLVCAAPAAADAPFDRRATQAGRIEVHAGASYEWATSAQLSDETPQGLITFGGGYFPVADVGVGLGGSVGILSPDSQAFRESSSQELYASVTAFYRLPLVRAFSGLRAGAYHVEVDEGDAIFRDWGPRLALDLGLRLALPRSPDAAVFVEPAVVLSLVVSHSRHHENNSSYPAFPVAALVGISVPVTF
jgi:hypothetical protein